MLRWIAFMSLAVVSAGCGPMTQPMVQRLPEEAQHQVDDVWDNLLQPPDRLDRTTLLDALTLYQLFQVGIDRLNMTSEKDVLGGRVVMTVRFDRAHPCLDEFTVTYVNRHGREVRRERYSREEVEESLELLRQQAADSRVIIREGVESQPAPELSEIDQKKIERLAKLKAATQPASGR